MARGFDRQVAEIRVRVAVLNRYTALGIPVAEAAGQVRPGKGSTVVQRTLQQSPLELSENDGVHIAAMESGRRGPDRNALDRDHQIANLDTFTRAERAFDQKEHARRLSEASAGARHRPMSVTRKPTDSTPTAGADPMFLPGFNQSQSQTHPTN